MTRVVQLKHSKILELADLAAVVPGLARKVMRGAGNPALALRDAPDQHHSQRPRRRKGSGVQAFSLAACQPTCSAMKLEMK